MSDTLLNVVKRQKSEFVRDFSKIPTHRRRLADLQRALPSPLVKIITGPRRCGKSTLARMAVKNSRFAYLNFEDEAIPEHLTGDDVMAALATVYPEADVFFFDEIQNMSRWEQFIHRLHRAGRNCVITGSNAHLLSREMATALTGRHIPIELLPFSYDEYLGSGHSDSPDSFMSYLVSGGFPEVVMRHGDSTPYLGTLWDSIVLKDVVRRHRIRNTQELGDLYAVMINAVTARFNHDSLVRSLDQRLSAPTIKKFVGYAREAYLFADLEQYHFGARKRIKSDRKLYTYDNGFVGAKRVGFSKDQGRLLENLVFVELVRRGFRPNFDLFYVMSDEGYEVDFLIRLDGRNEELIQVSWTLQEQKTRSRELRALRHAASSLGVTKARILTFDHEERIEEQGLSISVEPVRAWLRESPPR